MAKSTTERTRPRPSPRQRKQRRTSARTRQIVVLVVALLAVLILVRGVAQRGDIPAGVSVAGVDLGGMSADEARIALKTQVAPRLGRTVAVRLDDQRAPIVPAELDARVALQETIDEAMRTGRLRSLLLPFIYSAEIEPTLTAPLRPRIPANLRIVAEPPRNATVKIADGKAVVSPSRPGNAISPRSIVLSAARAAIERDRAIVLKSRVLQPSITTAEAREAANRALEITKAPVALNVDGKRVGALSTAVLENAVTVRNEDGGTRIAFKPGLLAGPIGEQLGDILREPVNAMWDTDGQRAWVVPAQRGKSFEPRAAADAVRDAAMGGGARQAAIDLVVTEPRRSTKEAESYGITTRVSGAITELGDSSENRAHNVALMADILDNRLVMPGETFSFNQAVGPRSPERGFLEGQAIVAGLLVPSIGGGVCQVATTLYDAAFGLGLDIVERTNHSFYIYHYGEGMDAAVSWDGVDLKFRNNTDHPVLIRASADASTMIVNLYSAPSDVTVESSVSARYDVKKPEKRYIRDPYAAPKSILKYTDGQEGFSVDVTRVVRRGGEVVSEATFPSTYVAEAETYIIGPEAFPPGDPVIEDPPYGWISPNAPPEAQKPIL